MPDAAPNSSADLVKAFPDKPPSPAQVRDMYPAMKEWDDGKIADALWKVYQPKYEENWSVLKKWVEGQSARIHFDADVGYDPYTLGQLPHDVGEVVSGASGGLVGPSAETDADRANQAAGRELWLGVGKQGGITPPQAVRGAAGRFQANQPQTWGNAAQIAATAKTPPSTAAVPALSSLLGHPLVKLGLAIGAGASGLSAGGRAILKHMGMMP